MKLVLDTSGEALRETIAAGGIHLAKPSLGEFEHFVGRSVKDPGALEEAAMEVVRSVRVDLLAVTMGHEGAVLAHAGGVLRLPAVKVDVRSAVGAGDSFVAAMTLALARGAPEIVSARLSPNPLASVTYGSRVPQTFDHLADRNLKAYTGLLEQAQCSFPVLGYPRKP